MQEWKVQNEQIEGIEKLKSHISYEHLHAVTRRPRMKLNLLFNRKAHNYITCYIHVRTFNEVTNKFNPYVYIANLVLAHLQ